MEKVIAYKKEMDQVFTEEGTVVPVTVLELAEDQTAKLEEGAKVDVRGKSKGKGFMGVVKRYSFAGAPKSHGTKHTLRKGGSIGAGTDPAKVWKGQKMPGRHAHKNVTIKNLDIVKVDRENNQLHVKGAVPGSRGTEIEIRSTKS